MGRMLAKSFLILLVVVLVALYFLGDGFGTRSNANHSFALPNTGGSVAVSSSNSRVPSSSPTTASATTARSTTVKQLTSPSQVAPRYHLVSQKPADMSKGMISFNFDDGFQSAYDIAVPMLNGAGFKTTQYIITRHGEVVGPRDPLYVSRDEVLQMAADGNEIGDHTETHPDLSKLPLDQAREQIDGAKSDLESIGITPTTFAYPEGSFNAQVEELVREAGFHGARITQPLLDDTMTDRFALRRQRVEIDTTWNDIKSAIDQAQAQHKWVILVYHRIDEGTNQISSSHQLLQQTIDYVKQVGIPVVTTEEGLEVLDALSTSTPSSE